MLFETNKYLTKPCDQQLNSLEHEITALQNMKHGKTLGINCFPAENSFGAH